MRTYLIKSVGFLNPLEKISYKIIMKHVGKKLTENTQQSKTSILIIGNPNVGKTTIFNQLSRKYAVTANYPFTTVEANSAPIRIEGREYELIDTAGIYRLDFPSEEGQITRDFLFNNTPKIIIQVIEAAKLEQSLRLTLQLLELKIPLILVLNMNDELAKQGVRLNPHVLSESLNVPIIETIAVEGKGIEKIKKVIPGAKTANYVNSNPPILKKYYQEIETAFPENKKPQQSILSLFALDDPYTKRWIEANYGIKILKKAVAQFNRFKNTNIVNLSFAILNSQNQKIQNIISRVITHKSEITKYGIQKFGEWSRHVLWGWLIVLLMIFLTYIIVGKLGANFLVVEMERLLFTPITNYLKSILTIPILYRFLVGDYGLLTTGLFNAIGTVLPIIILFFLVLNFLEDIGYLTNLVILTNRIFNKLGLTGKSILPIVLGFGCKTMATLSTKILDTKKEKYISIFLIGLAIPCSSQMSIIIAVLSKQPVLSFLIVAGILLFIELTAGLILNHIIPKDKQIDFIMEIPPIRLPDLKLLGKKTYYRSIWFLKEAVPLFLLGAFILFILHETGLISLLQNGLRPIVVDLLNLPINFTEAMVMSLARSEAGAVLVMDMANAGVLTPNQIIVSILVLTLFIPCISNVMAIGKELKWKKATVMVLIITMTSLLIGGGVNLLLNLLRIRL
ncbi:ferrous iron transport protein B [candidate division KSB1 bacterium]|nr:ferrous iron transport protein B [candidate division KSB1 bacterium]